MLRRIFPLTLIRIRNFVLFLTLIIIVGGFGYWLGQHKFSTNGGVIPASISVINRSQPVAHRDVDFSLFWQVWDELEKTYLRPEDINPEKMVFGAISGMTSALGDPYTVFLAPSDNKQNKENLSGSFFGVGIQIGFKNRRLAVIAPLDGMPAQKAGVKSGDYIVNIKDEAKGIDESTQDMTLPDAVSYIRGEEGTEVTLTLFREGGDDTFDVTITREEVVIPSVALRFLDQNREVVEEGVRSELSMVAHLRLTQFGERTKQEWQDAVSTIASRKNEVSGIVLDMRNNPGGYLSDAIEFASDFVVEGTVVVRQGRYQSETFKVVPGRGALIGIPVVVLVNEGSASAAEILAGALRDRIDVKLVGEQTFGKGTVQEVKDLEEGAGMHITTAEWVLPSGTKINSIGLTPDEVIELTDDEEGKDEQLLKALDMLNL